VKQRSDDLDIKQARNPRESAVPGSRHKRNRRHRSRGWRWRAPPFRGGCRTNPARGHFVVTKYRTRPGRKSVVPPTASLGPLRDDPGRRGAAAFVFSSHDEFFARQPPRLAGAPAVLRPYTPCGGSRPAFRGRPPGANAPHRVRSFVPGCLVARSSSIASNTRLTNLSRVPSSGGSSEA
jgi:hypothetical protein